MFDKRVAEFYAEYITRYIEELDLTTDEKLRLMDAVAQTILEGCEIESSANN